MDQGLCAHQGELLAKNKKQKKKISDPLGNGELKIHALIKHHLQTSAVMLGVSWRGVGGGTNFKQLIQLHQARRPVPE